MLFASYKNVELDIDASGSCAAAVERGQHVMLLVQHAGTYGAQSAEGGSRLGWSAGDGWLLNRSAAAVYTWEGSINKFLVDDKGLSALCIFGLPPMSHADDPKRATAAAKMLLDSVRELGPHVSVSVGIATGIVFTGVIGSQERREYTCIGHYVNIAARFMCVAKLNQARGFGDPSLFAPMPPLSLPHSANRSV